MAGTADRTSAASASLRVEHRCPATLGAADARLDAAASAAPDLASLAEAVDHLAVRCSVAVAGQASAAVLVGAREGLRKRAIGVSATSGTPDFPLRSSRSMSTASRLARPTIASSADSAGAGAAVMAKGSATLAGDSGAGAAGSGSRAAAAGLLSARVSRVFGVGRGSGGAGGGTGTSSITRSPRDSWGGGCAIRQLQASSRWTPSVASKGQPRLTAGRRGNAACTGCYDFAVMTFLIATQRWSSCSVSSSERRVPADSSFMVSAARCRRCTLLGVQLAGIIVPA